MMKRIHELVYSARSESNQRLLLEGQMEREAARTRYLADELVRLSAQCERQRLHGLQMEENKVEAERGRKQAVDKCEEVKAELVRSELHVEQLKTEVRDLQEEVNRVKRQRNDGRSGLDDALTTVRQWMEEASSEGDRTKARVEELEGESRELKGLLASVDKRHSEVVKDLEKRHEIDKLQVITRLNEERRELEKTNAASLSRLESLIRSKDQTIREKQVIIDGLSVNVKNHATKIAELTKQIESYQNEIKIFKRNEDSLNTEIRRLNSQPNALETLLKQRSEMINSKEQQIASLLQKITGMQQDLNKTKLELDNAKGDSNKQIENIQNKHSEEVALLNAKLTSASTLQNDLDNLQVKITNHSCTSVYLRLTAL